MSVVIYGGSGFIGQHLLNAIDSDVLSLDIKENCNISEFCDVRKPISLEIDRPSKVSPLNHSPEITLLFSGNSLDQVALKFLSIGVEISFDIPGNLTITVFVIG